MAHRVKRVRQTSRKKDKLTQEQLEKQEFEEYLKAADKQERDTKKEVKEHVKYLKSRL